MLLGARERQQPNAECTGLWVERSLCSCAKQGGGVWGSSLVLPWKLGEALPTWATWHKFRLLLLSIWDFCFLWQKLSCAWKYFLKHSSVADQWPLQINLHICDLLLLIVFIFLLESLLYWVIPFFFLQLMKEFPLMSVLNIHENLLEALLEMQAYSEVQVMK